MEIANLLKQKNTDTAPEVFLAVQIQEGLVKTALWQIDADIPQVLSFGSPQNYTDPEGLPLAVDTSLTHALANVESEPNRVLFGLPETWIKDNQLSPEVKEMITNITKQLELKPVGFVSITDALITHLKDKEGIPPSIILIEIGDTKVNVVVTRLGAVKGREEVDRSDDIAADVAEGLARIDTDQLPSRFLVINGNDNELEQQLISYPWMDKFPFLHLPKVEVPDPHFSIEAIAVSGGGEAARSLGYEISQPAAVEEPLDTSELAESATADVGAIHESPTESNVQAAAAIPGFVVDSDIRTHPVSQVATTPTATAPTTIPRLPIKFSLPNFKLPSLALPRLPRLSQLSFHRPKKILYLIPVLILALIAGFYTLSIFVLNTAQIEVLVDPHTLSKSVPIAIGSQASSLPSLNATPETFQIERTDSMPTTGEAVVGEQAKGQVVIFNKTDTPKNFPSGTVLTTDNGLRFLTDSDVTVASKSASSTIDISTGTQTINLGHETVSVTASKIGTESNLSSNTSLTVANFPLSSFEAKVNNELTGGTSRTVRAVSDADQKQLLSNVMEQVKQEAASKVSATGDQQAIPTADVKTTKQTFNKGVGEEAESLTLSVSASITVLKYNPQDLQQLVASSVTDLVPSGYDFDPSNTTVTVQDISSDEDEVTATALVEAKLIPKFDIDQYRSQIKGKSVNSVKPLFQTIAGYREATIRISQKLPFIADRLPYNGQKISITLTPAQ